MQRVLLLIFSLLWLGQGIAETLDAPSSPQVTQKESRDASLDDYHLGTGDKIEIIVYGEDDLSMKLKIGKAGLVNFPYIGEVKLTGRTPSEIETEIENRLRGDYLLNPMVTVNLESFRLFYISGEVEQPNGYEYQPRLTVEQAIAMAGGFTDRADKGDINIRSGSTLELIEDVELTHPVNPGDTVIVEQSFF
ncbi:TPA: polysaccharide export protein [Vibrio vulnificus]|uniref:Capsular polysaccharide synthesis enzyme CpsC, polysaccharide export n=1 Tax=Vibrio vulnificus TaxID=672 RepID=A0AAN1PM66_VIBVL|nr:polysaccharide biosynthesis/export family protein [Vibrio vulnificus]AIL70888.1 polysaccharide export-related protein [Vibrio vulnificus]ALM70574.1 Capsular polysaccharide synthesis enzyme CpsC, polysaccharide export [Vibrio vulnificus]ANH63618.1 Capsular polysaccharide synthesis enzyme CpsC, polysaccharide export [Vibrio vulnificus]AXX59489.1 Capsular polysaccharide synthesis enzyme CpsC, polysaccharide export [Vibrio vulnificus]EGQ7956075.1 polysaccharide export protein [Vibrio vulnificus